MVTSRYRAEALLLGLVWSLAQATAPVLSTGGSFLNTGLGPLSSAAGGGSPATLSAPTPSGTLASTTSATIGATTNEASGTLYAVADSSGNMSGITAAQIEAGHNATGAAAAGACTGSISSTSPSCTAFSLTVNTSYSYAEVQLNGNGPSNVVTGTFATATTSGPSLQFNVTDFGNAVSTMLMRTSHSAVISGTNCQVTGPTYSAHQAGACWTLAQYNVQTFTTDFKFTQSSDTYGAMFSVQNSPNGTDTSGDANGLGLLVYAPPINPVGSLNTNSVAISYNEVAFGQYFATSPNLPSDSTLYINGGPYNPSVPLNDLNPQGIGLQASAGDTMAVHLVYDGTYLVQTLTDTTSGAIARSTWPVNIPLVVGANVAYVGFAGGTQINDPQNIIPPWSYSTGYLSRLATPTISPAPGQYTSAQTVTITCPGGATCYYSTNGLPPTTNSTHYTGTFSVSTNQIIRAYAVESGFTDSFDAVANYQIQSGATPFLNFPSGFASSAGLIIPAGAAHVSSSNIVLQDSNANEAAAAWYATPVNVQSFTTVFQFTAAGNAGFCFAIQNQDPASTNATALEVSGGPTAVGQYGPGFGYQGLTTSMCLTFDTVDGPSLSETGIISGGAQPIGTIDMTGTGFKIWSGNPITVTLTYSGTTLTMSAVDTVNSDTFSHTFTSLNIPALVGGNTAYIGFTAGQGYGTGNTTLNSWTYHN